VKLCDRCYEEYEDDEIVLFDKESPKWICLPCKAEFDRRLKIFLIEFFNNQPERSKREDSSICDEAIREMKEFLDSTFDMRMQYCHEQLIEEMRCSEHCGNTVREVQQASSPRNRS
jgi:hypothetical protein